MNEPCNVRAVMKKAIEHLEHDNIMGTPQRELVVSLCEARAAVADLIKAAHYAHREMEDHRVKMGECNECREAERMLCSAFARVSGY